MNDAASPPHLEIAHVLYMDIVGYSRLPSEEQPRRIRALQDAVRGVPEFHRAEAAGELVPLPTGDGMALVFFRDPAAPVRCAMQLCQALRTGADLPLRMGLHTGPVFRVEDINANVNIAGGGVNLAQRVMDCGDAGHILLSNAVRELLGQVGEWPIHDLGECEVKHGVRLHLFSLQTEDIGNPNVPEKLRPRPSTDAPLTAAFGERATEAAARVVLLYDRTAQPDEELSRLLEMRLTTRGFQVFVDRHVRVGMEWAVEQERQFRTADAAIVLLSPTSIRSEMLAYEVEIVHAAARQEGKPRLLPVWVREKKPLSGVLAQILEPLRSALWDGPHDTDRLFTDLLRSLRAATPDRGFTWALGSLYRIIRGRLP